MVDDIFESDFLSLGPNEQIMALLRGYNQLVTEHNNVVHILGDCQMVRPVGMPTSAFKNRIQDIASLITPMASQLYDPMTDESLPFNREMFFGRPENPEDEDPEPGDDGQKWG
jgi:hypothetical protein